MIARIVIWSLFDSKTTLDELRAQLPELEGVQWIANEAQERFGVIATGPEPDLSAVQALIGVEPAVAEEFDTWE